MVVDAVAEAGAGVGVGRGAGGECARCGEWSADAVSVSAVVSKVFTGADGWAALHARSLCRRCAWMYTVPEGRTECWELVRRPWSARRVPRAEVVEVLIGGALGEGRAFTVPIRPGRRHLLPLARWGRIAVDDASLPWGKADAARLRFACRLRRIGVPAGALGGDVVPYEVVRRLPPGRVGEVLDLWSSLTEWGGTDNPWLRMTRRLLGGDYSGVAGTRGAGR